MRTIAIVFILILLSAPVWADLKDKAPEGATPASSPAVTSSPETPANTPEATRFSEPAPPAPKAARPATPPPTHPPVVRGHHYGVGHQNVYREILGPNGQPGKCGLVSKSYVDARDQKLGKEFRAELKSEAQARASADQKLSERIKPLEEKKNSAMLIFAGMILVGLTAVLVVGISQQ